MPQTYTVPTDNAGLFNEVTHFNSPAFFAFTVHNVYLTITSPPNLTVDGSVDLFAKGKHTTAKLNTSTGQKISLGSWHVAHSDNIPTIAGRTIPPVPHAEVIVEVDHS
jgi:hypothetical protein